MLVEALFAAGITWYLVGRLSTKHVRLERSRTGEPDDMSVKDAYRSFNEHRSEYGFKERPQYRPATNYWETRVVDTSGIATVSRYQPFERESLKDRVNKVTTPSQGVGVPHFLPTSRNVIGRHLLPPLKL